MTPKYNQYNRGNPFDPKRIEYFYFGLVYIVLVYPFSFIKKRVHPVIYPIILTTQLRLFLSSDYFIYP